MTPTTSTPTRDLPMWRVWLAIVFLGIGAFTIVTTELVPIGLLTPMALDLGRDEASMGLTVTLYAWVGAGSALLSAVWLVRFPRRPLLIGMMLGLAVSNGLVLLADSFGLLLAARVVGAVSHGLFWAMVGTTAAQIAPERHAGRATSIVFGGVSAASVIGVPLATLLGQWEGWRAAFGAVGLLGLATAVVLLPVLPRLRPEAQVGGAGLRGVLRRSDLWGIYLATALAVIGHFAAFTYIEPFLSQSAGMRSALVAALLFGFGAAGLLGNVLTGAFVDRYLRQSLVLALLAMSAALLLLGQSGQHLGPVGITVALVVWGVAIAAIFVGFQTWILRAAGAAAMPASAVYVAIFNAAIGLGAMAGAWVLNHGGLPAVMVAAGSGAALSILVVAWLGRPVARPRAVA